MVTHTHHDLPMQADIPYILSRHQVIGFSRMVQKTPITWPVHGPSLKYLMSTRGRNLVSLLSDSFKLNSVHQFIAIHCIILNHS